MDVGVVGELQLMSFDEIHEVPGVVRQLGVRCMNCHEA